MDKISLTGFGYNLITFVFGDETSSTPSKVSDEEALEIKLSNFPTAEVKFPPPAVTT
jgi:hypothetical protein